MAPKKGDSLEERLMLRIAVHPQTGCWEWTGKREGPGPRSARYGVLSMGGRNGRVRKAHRLAAMLWLDFDIDDERRVLHHCDNPPCINPAHLYIGTPKDNARDRAARRRGRESNQQGEENPNRRLTEADVREIVRLVESGLSQSAVAKRFDIKQPHVSRIVRRKGWRHLWE